MSADNWAICPQCKQKVEQDQRALIARAANAYGNVSEVEYHKLKKEVASFPSAPEHTLREDYDMGIWEGKFEVTYKAACSECTFRHTFRATEEIVLP